MSRVTEEAISEIILEGIIGKIAEGSIGMIIMGVMAIIKVGIGPERSHFYETVVATEPEAQAKVD